MLTTGATFATIYRLLIFAAHDDELPNDWRFSTVDHIVNSLADYGQPQDSAWDVEAYREVSWEIAESGADSYTSQNVSWVAENVGSCCLQR